MANTPFKKKILIISHDKIGKSMAGPGIRYHSMAQMLSEKFDVTIGFFDPSYIPSSDFKRRYKTLHVDKGVFEPAFDGMTTIIAMWLSDEMIAYAKKNHTLIVFDVYAPVPVENLALFLFTGDVITAQTDYSYRQSYNMYPTFFAKGDLFLFSNRRQLDFWMGYVFGSDLIRVSTYNKRPLFERFIYAPMGIDSKTPLKKKKVVMRNTIPGIFKDDKIILWTGGIWNWFDAQTLIRAMAKLREVRPDIKLVFFGTKHPNPDVPAMHEATESFKLARKLQVLDRNVFMYEGWVPYEERMEFLLEADAAVNTTKDTFESELSHRTRVLDHFLACLPTVATSGDYISDEVIAPLGLGKTVAPNDVDALAAAIEDVVDPHNHANYVTNIRSTREDFDWQRTLGELQRILLSGIKPLPEVQTSKPKELPKDRLLYKAGKHLLPKPVKKVIVKVGRYGR